MAKKNLETEFVVPITLGDRQRKYVVRSPAFTEAKQAADHVKKLQEKGHLPAGDIGEPQERPRDNSKRPKVLEQAMQAGVEINNPSGPTSEV